MKNLMKLLSACALLAGLGLVLGSTTSCKLRQSSSDSSTISTNSNGRYQLVTAQMGERGTMVFMVDTRDGGTWYFQPPQGALINGFWSNVPRLTFGDQYWEQVMRQMLTPQTGAGATGATSLTSTQRMSSLPVTR